MIPVKIPLPQFRSRERSKLHFRDSNFTNFPGGMSPDARRSSCLRHSTFAPAARTVHVRQLNHCIRYFQMLPKILIDRNKKAYLLTLIWNQLNFTLPYSGGGRDASTGRLCMICIINTCRNPLKAPDTFCVFLLLK